MEAVAAKIKKLCDEKNAVILAHNYQIGPVQDIADYIGDSLGLSIAAGRTDADIIVFCGVSFMAETAAIISPHKKVLLPDLSAGCPMADMITAPQLREIKSRHPGAAVICYVNSSAEVKAESDICCTSSNALKVASVFAPEREIIFVPDKYLGSYTARQLGRKFILSSGYCPTHVKIMPEKIRTLKKKYPDALVLAHPECPGAVLELADAICSTGGMLSAAKKTSRSRIIVATEIDMCHRLRRENPDKEFFPASDAAVCPNMKKTTLEKVLHTLETESGHVEVDKEIAGRAKRAIDAMMNV